MQHLRSLDYLRMPLCCTTLINVLPHIKSKCVLWTLKKDDAVVTQVDVRDWRTDRPDLVVLRTEECDTKQYLGAPTLSREVNVVIVCYNKFLVIDFGTQQCLPEACAWLCAEKGVPDPEEAQWKVFESGSEGVWTSLRTVVQSLFDSISPVISAQNNVTLAVSTLAWITPARVHLLYVGQGLVRVGKWSSGLGSCTTDRLRWIVVPQLGTCGTLGASPQTATSIFSLARKFPSREEGSGKPGCGFLLSSSISIW